MRQLIVAILLIVAISLQSALRAVWQPLGFIDFALVLVVYFALQREPLLALITAAAAGLALDLISGPPAAADRKSTRLNSSHGYISYAVFCLKKKNNKITHHMLYSKKKQTTN